MTEEEYQRERNRLKQIRHRKRQRAEREGLEPDYYITPDDYIDAPIVPGDPDDMSEQEHEQDDNESEYNGRSDLNPTGGLQVHPLIFIAGVLFFIIGYAWLHPARSTVASGTSPIEKQEQSPGVPYVPVVNNRNGSGMYGNPYS